MPSLQEAQDVALIFLKKDLANMVFLPGARVATSPTFLSPSSANSKCSVAGSLQGFIGFFFFFFFYQGWGNS